MKRLFLLLTCLISSTAYTQAQTATIQIDAGLLENSTGTAVVPNGMLLQILASPSGTFSAPNSQSYVTGDNVLLGNFAMNSNSGQAGETLTNDTFSLATFNLTAGEALLLRFYPSLSGTSVPTAPTLGTTYGQVRSSTIESGINDGSQTAWVVPATGSVDLLYITASADNGVTTGTYSNASAFASNVVPAAVPEPSTFVMLGVAMLSLLGFMFARRTA